MGGRIGLGLEEKRKSFDHALESFMGLGRIQEMSHYTQHGGTSTLDHVVGVAWQAFVLSYALRIRVSEQDLIRGAVLHDYYLYDWHDATQAPDRWHGFTHPRHAFRNAEDDFDDLSAIERDIILHHMFPLHPVPPCTKEGWLVCISDKVCAVKEMLRVV